MNQLMDSFFTKQFNFKFCFKINFIIAFASLSVFLFLSALAHYIDSSLNCSQLLVLF